MSVFDKYVPEVVLSCKKQPFKGLDFEAVRFQDSRHMRVVRFMSALRPPLPPRKYS